MSRVPGPSIDVPTFVSQRLVLEPLSLAHSDLMFDLWSDPLICQHAGPVADYDGNALAMPAADHATSDKIIHFWQCAAQDGWGFRWAIVTQSTKDPIGLLGFNSLNATSEIAYFLKPRVWGQGFMSEAVSAALDWRTAQGPCTAFEAFIEADNVKSVALAQRLGFVADGTASEGALRHVKNA